MSPGYTYSRWDGSQGVSDVNEDALLSEFSEGLLTRGDVSSALRSLVQRGLRTRSGENVKGVQDLLQQLRGQRQDLLRQHDLGSVLEDLRQLLDQVLQTERAGMDRRLHAARQQAEAAREAGSRGEELSLPLETAQGLLDRLQAIVERKREFLDALPKDLGGAIRELNDYEFMDPEAQRLFAELKRMLQQQFLDQQFQRMSQTLQESALNDLQATAQMLRDLNRMLEQHLRGEKPDLRGFMGQWGEALGDPDGSQTQSLEDLVGQLQRQAAQMESLLNSLSPDQRRRLQEVMESILQDQEMRQQMADLRHNLEALSPTGELGRRYPFQGEEPVTLQEALDLMERLRLLDDLEQQLKKTQQGGSLQDVDAESLREVLGEESFQSLEQLRRFAEMLEDAGYIKLVGSKYELTPRGIRHIGQKALAEIFAYIKKDYAGTHFTRERGRGGEPSDATKAYEFGDPFTLHLQRTIGNALLRGAEGFPVRLDPKDFEVYETEDLVGQLQRQAAQMESLLNSLSPDQR
ncbi:MAG: VWA domain-containing protein, partial [Chloroflexi bacterium]|nr:VWA domain-containing protein [Chloroflexota bacterium]